MFKTLKSNYCKAVFTLAFFLGYFLLPEAIFHNTNRFLAIVYLLVFASLVTCVVRTIKEDIQLAHKNKSSILGTVAAILGFSAFQFCGVAAPVCGISIGAGIVSALFPNFLHTFFTDHAFTVIYISIAIQLAALIHLKCWKR